MATLYVPVTRSTEYAERLLSAVTNLRNGINKLRSCQTTMAAMTDAGNYTEVETYFGLPVGEGFNVKSNVDGTLTEIDADATLNQLMNMLGA